MSNIHGMNEIRKSSSRGSTNRNSRTSTLVLNPTNREEINTESDTLIKKSVHTRFKQDVVGAITALKQKYNQASKEALVAHKVLNDKDLFEKDLIRELNQVKRKIKSLEQENERLMRQRVDDDFEEDTLELLLQMREDDEPDIGETETAAMYEEMSKKYGTHIQ